MTKLLLPEKGLWLPHRSTSDWDFQNPTWELDPTRYVSSPSSLSVWGASALPNPWAILCKAADTIVIDQGRIVSWLQKDNWVRGNPWFFFRAQAAVGTATPNNAYAIIYTIDNIYWRYVFADGSYTDIVIWEYPQPVAEWWKDRVTWWNGKNLQNEDATVCRVERLGDAGWAAIGDDAYDTNERNKGSAINRVGVGYSWAIPPEFIQQFAGLWAWLEVPFGLIHCQFYEEWSS